MKTQSQKGLQHKKIKNTLMHLTKTYPIGHLGGQVKERKKTGSPLVAEMENVSLDGQDTRQREIYQDNITLSFFREN